MVPWLKGLLTQAREAESNPKHRAGTRPGMGSHTCSSSPREAATELPVLLIIVITIDTCVFALPGTLGSLDPC